MRKKSARERALKHLLNLEFPLHSTEINRFCEWYNNMEDSRLGLNGDEKDPAIYGALRIRLGRSPGRSLSKKNIQQKEDANLCKSYASELSEERLKDLKRYKEEGISLNEIITIFNGTEKEKWDKVKKELVKIPPRFDEKQSLKIAEYVFSKEQIGRVQRILKGDSYHHSWAKKTRSRFEKLVGSDEQLKLLIEEIQSNGRRTPALDLCIGKNRWTREAIKKVVDKSEDQKLINADEQLIEGIQSKGSWIPVANLYTGKNRWTRKAIEEVIERSAGILNFFVMRPEKGSKGGRPSECVRIGRIYRILFSRFPVKPPS